jgi:hypothetical protein
LEDGAAGVVGVNEHVLAAALWRDEPEPLSRVEELNRTFLHFLFSFFAASFLEAKAFCAAQPRSGAARMDDRIPR